MTIWGGWDPLANYAADKRALYEQLPQQFTTAEFVNLATKLDIKERTVKRFLLDRKLFIQLKRGQYSKII